MPIKFRCSHCQQFLGISRSKASTLTDCPTCGRTIRVPALDGTVAPVPSPKLNLEDSELRNALGALANLEGGQADEPEEEMKVASAIFKPSLHQDEGGDSVPAFVAEPIPQTEQESDSEEIGANPEDNAEMSSPLSELANSEYAIPIVEPELSERHQLFRYGLLAIIGIMLLVIGFIIGRVTHPNSLNSEAVADIQEDEKRLAGNALNQGEEVAVSKEEPQLSGKITYETESGEQRADKGARVLILPVPHNEASKFSAEGFRVGATKTEQNDFAKKITSFGGKFTVVDAEGKFELNNLQDGKYAILIGSRFQSRDELQSVEEDITKFISIYFENPARVLGQVQYYYQEVEFNNDSNDQSLIVDHDFRSE